MLPRSIIIIVYELNKLKSISLKLNCLLKYKYIKFISPIKKINIITEIPKVFHIEYFFYFIFKLPILKLSMLGN